MYHKIIGGKKSKGQRNINKSIEYLLREKNPEQQKDIKILSTTTKQDLINFENYILDKNKSNPYLCGVLSFEEKTIPEELKTKIITEFEDILFVGIEPENRPPVLWVEHNDKGRLELNYLTFNSLQDRRSYTVYLDKLDRALINNYSEIINYENNLSSPFEKKENKNTLVNNPKTNIPENKKDYLDKINTEILALIINEELDNREEAIKYIENLPGVKINRIRKNQISIKCDFFDDKPIVLKGDIYEEGRNYSDYRKEYDSKPKRDPQLVEAKLTELKKSFSGRIEKRKIRNRERFKNSQIKNKSENTKDIERENINIEYGSINNNIGFTVNNNSFTNTNDSLFNMEKIKNESINSKYKTKTEEEERGRIARARNIEQINKQQQLIKRRIEEVRRTDSQLSKSIETTGERLRRDRRSLQSIIYNARRHIRTLSIYFRKNEHKRYFEEKKRLEEEKQFNQRRRKKFIY
ncbi:Atg14 domain-containing protein (plasmid) [Klebsiella quasipneumoniae]|uniref:hypothetical protein n=1 Tax=Klebsiella quasipneumoniae TaxID=1463165 RepID=UPI002876B94A|nr:hypothetical protein [Klebsiella quasipneumoniae]MDS0276175.1 Atg14 domain-containing protein [Klebsiella quasipneumoniae]